MKIVAAAAVLFIALGAVALVYANTENLLYTTTNEAQMGMQNMQTFSWPDNCTMPGHMRRMPEMRANGFESLRGFLENATLSTVQGTIVSDVNGMLVLDTGSNQVRVMLPKNWNVGTEVVNRTSLFNSTFASPGQSVTIKVLESDIINNESFSINTMMGYEAINATSTHAYAVLPFNIQLHS